MFPFSSIKITLFGLIMMAIIMLSHAGESKSEIEPGDETGGGTKPEESGSGTKPGEPVGRKRVVRFEDVSSVGGAPVDIDGLADTPAAGEVDKKLKGKVKLADLRKVIHESEDLETLNKFHKLGEDKINSVKHEMEEIVKINPVLKDCLIENRVILDKYLKELADDVQRNEKKINKKWFHCIPISRIRGKERDELKKKIKEYKNELNALENLRGDQTYKTIISSHRICNTKMGQFQGEEKEKAEKFCAKLKEKFEDKEEVAVGN